MNILYLGDYMFVQLNIYGLRQILYRSAEMKSSGMLSNFKVHNSSTTTDCQCLYYDGKNCENLVAVSL